MGALSARCRWRPTVATLVALLTMSACGAESPSPDRRDPDAPAIVTELNPGTLHGTVIDSLARPSEVLRDTSGRPFSLADRPEDELTVLFFGYTHCPDVCPTTMADLAVARAQLPPKLRNKVTIVFVTEDPERDTNRALRRWLDRYDRSVVGLRGGNRATRAMLKHLYLPATKIRPNPEQPIQHPESDDGHHHDHGRYGVEHASMVYAFGPEARTVVYTGGTRPGEYASDFAKLLDPSAVIR
jgi:protein SCO1/2